jgi:hypothetical protein
MGAFNPVETSLASGLPLRAEVLPITPRPAVDPSHRRKSNPLRPILWRTPLNPFAIHPLPTAISYQRKASQYPGAEVFPDPFLVLFQAKKDQNALQNRQAHPALRRPTPYPPGGRNSKAIPVSAARRLKAPLARSLPHRPLERSREIPCTDALLRFTAIRTTVRP